MMKRLFKPISIIILLQIFLPGGYVFAQKMEVESVTINQFETPILKGKNTNPVFQIEVKTTGNKKPISLQSIEIEINGTNIQNDIEEVAVFYTGDKPFLRDGTKFGNSKKPSQEVKISGNQKLVNGTNIFWVSFKLKNSANILNKLSANCLSLIIDGKEIIPEIISTAIS